MRRNKDMKSRALRVVDGVCMLSVKTAEVSMFVCLLWEAVVMLFGAFGYTYGVTTTGWFINTENVLAHLFFISLFALTGSTVLSIVTACTKGLVLKR